MFQFASRCDSLNLVRNLWQSSVVAWSLRFCVVAIAVALPHMAAHAADNAGVSATAQTAPDIIDRQSRKQAAGQRIEELDQQAWKALSKDGEVDLAIINMSRAADLARTEFGGDHWLTVLKESQAAGFKSLTDLQPPARQLFIEASKGQAFAAFQWSQGNKDRALAQMRQAHEKRTQAVGPDHVLSANLLLGLAFHEIAAEDFREAKRHALDAVRVLKTTWGERNPGWAHAVYYQALAERGLADLEPAERHFREVIEILEPVAQEGCSDFYLMMYSDAQLDVARLLNERGRFAEAEPFARRGSEVVAFASRHAFGRFLESQVDLARSASGQGKFAEAEIVFTCLFKSLPANPPPDSLTRILTAYAEHLRRTHREKDAEQMEARIRQLSAQAKPKSAADSGTPAAADAPAATRKK